MAIKEQSIFGLAMILSLRIDESYFTYIEQRVKLGILFIFDFKRCIQLTKFLGQLI